METDGGGGYLAREKGRNDKGLQYASIEEEKEESGILYIYIYMEEETPRFDGRIMQRSLLSLFFSLLLLR